MTDVPAAVAKARYFLTLKPDHEGADLAAKLAETVLQLQARRIGRGKNLRADAFLDMARVALQKAEVSMRHEG